MICAVVHAVFFVIYYHHYFPRCSFVAFSLSSSIYFMFLML